MVNDQDNPRDHICVIIKNRTCGPATVDYDKVQVGLYKLYI